MHARVTHLIVLAHAEGGLAHEQVCFIAVPIELEGRLAGLEGLSVFMGNECTPRGAQMLLGAHGTP
jgi:hypothetical protein